MTRDDFETLFSYLDSDNSGAHKQHTQIAHKHTNTHAHTHTGDCDSAELTMVAKQASVT